MCLSGSTPSSSCGPSIVQDHSPKHARVRNGPLGMAAAQGRLFGTCEGKPSRLVVFFCRNGDLGTANFPH